MPKADKSYQALSIELEEVLVKLQDPATDVDEVLKLHDRGQFIVKELEQYLKSAQNKIRVIKAKGS